MQSLIVISSSCGQRWYGDRKRMLLTLRVHRLSRSLEHEELCVYRVATTVSYRLLTVVISGLAADDFNCAIIDDIRILQ
jgi:hypothetical protein